MTHYNKINNIASLQKQDPQGCWLDLPEYDITATVAFWPAPNLSKPTSSIVFVVNSGLASTITL